MARTCRCPPTPTSPSRSAPGWPRPGPACWPAAWPIRQREHQDFPGTLSIGTEAVELLLVELCRSATRTFSRVLLVSTHGGNAGAVRRAERRLRAESRDIMAWLPAGEGDAHAGRAETSLELALAPGRVRPGHAEGRQHPAAHRAHARRCAAPACAR